MKYRIILHRRAQRDICRIAEQMAKTSAVSAERFMSGIDKAIKTLETLPERFAESEDSVGLPIILREFIYGKRGKQFRIFYEVREDRVIVHHVRHANRNRLTPDEWFSDHPTADEKRISGQATGIDPGRGSVLVSCSIRP